MSILARLKSWRILEPVVLLSCAAIFSLIYAFLEIAEDVTEGDTHQIDTKILMLLRDGNDPQNALGPPWVEEMMRDISGLGGIIILTFVTLGAMLYLLMLGKKWRALYLVITVTIGTLLSNALKYGYARSRPDMVPHGSYVFTNSFPSGHSMMAAVVYLSVGALLAKSHKSLHMKFYFIATAIFLTVVIGISRVYLGVHWPTDVLAGWAAGALCALLFWFVEWYWQERVSTTPPSSLNPTAESHPRR